MASIQFEKAEIMTNVGYIFFDLGNVIVNFSHELAVEQIAFVAEVSTAQVRELVFDGDLQIRYETGDIDGAQFYAEFCAATGSTVGCDALLLAYSDIFHLNEPIVPLITALAKSKIPLGILSNTCECHWDFVTQRHPILQDFFSDRVLSYEEHSMKPDKKIYESAIELAGTEPAKIFFTDDKPENVAGAIQAGMDAVLFESSAGMANDLRQRGIDVG
jgi:putative hydrolase of the HAD superfamily